MNENGFRKSTKSPARPEPAAPKPPRDIMLVDMDSFFAQVEQRNNPALRGRPVLVGGNPALRHGVVAAASVEAKRCGVRSGMSYFEAIRLCPDAVLVEGDTDRYVDCCHRLVDIFRGFTDMVECYSIDEAFLDVTHARLVSGPPAEIARRVKQRVRRELNLTCSVGIGPNKLVAKMACEWRKPDGLTVVAPEELPEILWALPVEELVGIGRRMKKRLAAMGITTIGRLARFPPGILREKFGVYGNLLHQWANGIDDSPVDPDAHLTVKSMGHSHTLPRDTDDPAELRWYLFWLSDKVGRRLRKDNYHGRTVTLAVRTSDFLGFTRNRTLPFHANSPHIICDTAVGLLRENLPRLPVRLLGISVSQLAPTDAVQLRLYENLLRTERTLKAMDAVKDRYGDGALTFAALLPAKRRIRKKIGIFLTNREKGNRRSPLVPPEARE